MARNTILFLHSSAPQPNKLGSNVIFYRHLTKLENSGWRIMVALPDSSKNPNQKFPDSWQLIIFPSKKWWYPPFRDYLGLKILRYYLLFKSIQKKLTQNHPDFIIGYLWGNYISGFDAYLSKKLKIPLGVFYHDDQKFFAAKEKKREIEKHKHFIARQASVIWTVSEELVFAPPKYSRKHIVIPPIPEEKQFLESSINSRPRNLVYAGRVYPQHQVYFDSLSIILTEIGWSLTIITSEDRKWESKSANIFILPLLPTTEDLLQYVKKNAGAILVAYPEKVEEGQMEWIKNCFPSKFIEFVTSGIPTIAVAPIWTSFGKWCVKREWPLYSEVHKDVPSFIDKMEKDRLFLDKYYQKAKEISYDEFAPNSIHTKFEQSILKVINQTASEH